MSKDPDALEADLRIWTETYARLHRRKGFRNEAHFALGAIHGCLETLEALGFSGLEERLVNVAREAAPPDEVELAAGALFRWLGPTGPSPTPRGK